MADLTKAEQQLVDAVEAGTLLDLSDEPDAVIRASMIRDILRGKLAADPDPRGVRLAEATIIGELDLTNLRTSMSLSLASCQLPEPVRMDRSHLTSVELTGCDLASVSGQYLVCEHDMALAGIQCSGGVELPYARVGGHLILSEAILGCEEGPALNLDGAQITGTVFLDEKFQADATSELGTIPARRCAHWCAVGSDQRHRDQYLRARAVRRQCPRRRNGLCQSIPLRRPKRPGHGKPHRRAHRR